MFIAVAHITGFKIFSILVQKLFPMREIHLIFCTLVRYTKRGRYLLTNVKNQILVYETVDYKLIYCFRKHPCLVKQFLFVEETREVVSASDAQDLFLWRVIDSDQKLGSSQNKSPVYGHNSHEMYLDFDYCASLDLFLGCTESKTFVMYGDKCQVHLANFASDNFRVKCLKIDRGSEVLLAGTSQGSLVLFSLVHIFQILREKMSRMDSSNASRKKVLDQICTNLGFYDEAEHDRLPEQNLASILTGEGHERRSQVKE